MNVVSAAKVAAVRQHGAMDHTTPPCDLDEVRLYRLGRVREQLRQRDLAAIVLYDQVNARYATDATNMQLWCSQNDARYVLVPAEGPVVLFDFGGKTLLSEGLPTIDEVRASEAFLYFSAGGDMANRARRWAAELDELVRSCSGANKRIAMDRIAPLGTQELERLGYRVFDGMEVMECARAVKSPGEIALMRVAIGVCEQAIQGIREALRPGITENALWAELHRGNIGGGGEWIETRLLASGPRTNPWFRECSMRVIEKGDMVSFDTDLIGPYGYCCDMSRSWVCDAAPSDEQRRIYAVAHEHLQHDMELLKAGMSYREITEKLKPLREDFRAGRYNVAMHGVGLADEHPAIYYPEDFADHGYDGVLEEGQVICVESLAAESGAREAVKLEEQVLITADGIERLTSYPMETSWL